MRGGGWEVRAVLAGEAVVASEGLDLEEEMAEGEPFDVACWITDDDPT